MGFHRTLLRGRLGTDNWDYWLPTITQFKTQPNVIIFHTFVWSCCQLQLHDVLLQRGRKNKRRRKRKNGRGLPYFEDIMLIRSVLVSLASFLWYYLPFLVSCPQGHRLPIAPFRDPGLSTQVHTRIVVEAAKLCILNSSRIPYTYPLCSSSSLPSFLAFSDYTMFSIFTSALWFCIFWGGGRIWLPDS